VVFYVGKCFFFQKWEYVLFIVILLNPVQTLPAGLELRHVSIRDRQNVPADAAHTPQGGKLVRRRRQGSVGRLLRLRPPVLDSLRKRAKKQRSLFSKL
jgi:hypothetical protein